MSKTAENELGTGNFLSFVEVRKLYSVVIFFCLNSFTVVGENYFGHSILIIIYI